MTIRALVPTRTHAIIAATLLALAVVLTAMKSLEVQRFEGDTAMFFQATENVARHGAPTSDLFAHIQAMEHSRIFRKTAAEIAADPLVEPPLLGDNVLQLHAYFVLYPLGWLAALLPVQVVLFGAFALAFAGLLYCVLAMLLDDGVALGFALLFGAIVVTHPAFGDSLLYGQFYPDRLFMLAGMLLVLAATRGTSRAALLAASIFCGSVDERGALVGGLALLLVTALWWRSNADRGFKLALGALLVLFGVVISHVLLVQGDAGGYFPTNAAMLARVLSPTLLGDSLVFICVNAVLFAFACFEWRAALVALAMMLPNLLGSIGGAEKIGFITHYHSFYFPILVWAAALGYARAYRFARERTMLRGLGAASVAALLLAASVEPYTSAPTLSLARIGETFVPSFVGDASVDFSRAGIERSRIGEQLTAAVPAGATVVAPEAAMSFLYRDRTLTFFPLGIDRAAYVVRPIVSAQDGHYVYGGSISKHGPDEARRIDALLTERMRRDGFDVDHPIVVPGFDLAVLARTAAQARR